MATATDDHLNEVRRRIARLEAETTRGTTEATSRLRPYITPLRRDEESTRALAHEQAAAVDERLQQLDNDLELAEHRVAAEFAATEGGFAEELEGELRRWDAHLDRMQTKAAATTGDVRDRAETAIADLRQRRVTIGRSRSELGTTASEGWHDVRARVLAELDELKNEADAAKPMLSRANNGKSTQRSR